jgi:hypothetical protein
MKIFIVCLQGFVPKDQCEAAIKNAIVDKHPTFWRKVSYDLLEIDLRIQHLPFSGL